MTKTDLKSIEEEVELKVKEIEDRVAVSPRVIGPQMKELIRVLAEELVSLGMFAGDEIREGSEGD